MTELARGRLLDPSAAPPQDEEVVELARFRNVVVQQILSGEVATPVEYLSDADELVVLLAGAAVLDVDGERLEMSTGEWALLPAHVPHRLVAVDPGTNWFAVHVG